MKKGLLLLALLGGLFVNAQTVINLQEHPNAELIDSLDATFPPALGPDSISPVMGDRFEEFQGEWIDFLTDFSTYLNDRDYRWGKPTRAFVRLYSNPEGEVQFILYKFYAGSMEESNYYRFPELLESFLKENSIPLAEPAMLPFSQCGPVTFVDAP
jgi:hypothetical protein